MEGNISADNVEDLIDIASPCLGVCMIDTSDDLCRGCFRSRGEIARWSGLSRTEKYALLEQLKDRRMAAGIGRLRHNRRHISRKSRGNDR